MMPLKVCLDARVDYGLAGGVEQFIIGLAHGFSEIGGRGEDYAFLAWEDAADWLAPYARGAARILTVPREPWRSRGRTVRGLIPVPARRALDRHVVPYLLAHRRERSDGTLERHGFDVVHFTRQIAFETSIPSVYHPHDLQHVHLPAMFTRAERHYRDVVYRRYARQARIIVATSSWCRDDFVRHFGVRADAVRVVPLAPASEAYDELRDVDVAAVRARWPLPERFIFYPAQTWPHKNHLALVDAAARLRGRGTIVPLVFSGRRNELSAEIERQAAARNVSVLFTGFVTAAELQALYQLSRAVVIPTLFEAASFPLWEAWLAGRAAACSTVTSLPKQAGDAALLFDPRDPAAIAAAVERLWNDDALCAALAARGRARVCLFTWAGTARMLRACYRLAAGRELDAGDRALLDAEPLL